LQWALAFKDTPAYRIVSDNYNILRMEGYEFPEPSAEATAGTLFTANNNLLKKIEMANPGRLPNGVAAPSDEAEKGLWDAYTMPCAHVNCGKLFNEAGNGPAQCDGTRPEKYHTGTYVRL
jgi:hypothetical protein